MNKRQLARIRANKVKLEKTKAKIEQEDRELMSRGEEVKNDKMKLILFALGGLTVANLMATVVNFTILKEMNLTVETIMQFMVLFLQQ